VVVVVVVVVVVMGSPLDASIAAARHRRTDSLSAGDLEPDVATRPAAIAAAASAAEQQWQLQQRIPPARSRRGHVAHQKKHREEAVLTCRPAQRQHQPQAKLQHVDWHTLLRHICNASSR
jgi:hypothetical protein